MHVMAKYYRKLTWYVEYLQFDKFHTESVRNILITDVLLIATMCTISYLY